MPSPLSRRRFLQSTAAVALAPALAGAAADPKADEKPAATPSKKLNLALIGVGGRGFDHVREVSKIDEANIIAICDVDAVNLVNAARNIPKAQPFVDFRDVLKLKDLDAVLIATPDHSHAVITAAALRAGKHVYCEKPLTHTVRECRAIVELAKQTGLVTQLGIQIHAFDNYRRVVEIIQAGAVGPVHEVHIWNNRTNRAPDPSVTPPPASLNYDLWLGPLSPRPFHPGYHPYNWRRWWAFGSGLLGDIGCHLMDVAFWSLDLQHPTKISAEGSELSDEICADTIVATYEFPARGEGKPPVKMTWYDPPRKPAQIGQWKLDDALRGEGVMFVGEGGMLCTDYGHHMLLPAEKFKDFKPPTTRLAHSPGHQREWVLACLKNDPAAASAPFSYGGLLSETALLGVAAFRARKPLEWDATSMRFPNVPEAEKFIAYSYRDGWSI